MGIFDNLVQAQSADQIELFKTVLIFAYIILIPYFSILVGASMLSVFFNKKGLKENSLKDIKFAKQLIDLVTFNKSIVFAFGIIPMLSITFIYSQLLKNVEVNFSGYLLFSALLFLCGVVFVYIFKYSFHLSEILKFSKENDIEDNEIKEDLYSFKSSTETLYTSSGTVGVIILLVSSYFFIATVQLASDSSRWIEIKNYLDIIFSGSTFINYLTFLALSITITAVSLLYTYCRNAVQDDYNDYIKDIILKTGFTALIVLPVFIVLSIIENPAISLSGEYFIYSILSLGLILLMTIKFYFVIKTKENNFASLLFLLILFVCINVYKDQTAFATNSKYEKAVIVDEYNKLNTEKVTVKK